ncbi:unnamed protein product [Protopolystoma xenopodis]|uniref:Uncharacterized protein n=1 Tax=Protopolystoma xenopodis TaxID=117903 RepID=A0A3S5AS70_9PLAT|nr:unnamed protein product [Protopolystoma xenopodis]
MLSEITEDIDAVANGDLFRLVVEHLLEHWAHEPSVFDMLNQMLKVDLPIRGIAKRLLGEELIARFQEL